MKTKIITIIFFVLFGTCFTFAQDAEIYTITGRVVDDFGKPISEATATIAPVTDKTECFDCISEVKDFTETDGKFTLKIYRKKLASAEHFLWITVDEGRDFLGTLDAPFYFLRKQDISFNGKLVILGKNKKIDIGDVKVQIRYGKAVLDFSSYFTKSKINKDTWDWGDFFINIITAKKAKSVHFSGISQEQIRRYVDKTTSKLKISIPEGKWKIEIVRGYPIQNLRKYAETDYFEIRHNEAPKEIILRPTKKVKVKV